MGENPPPTVMDTERTIPMQATITIPSFDSDDFADLMDEQDRLTDEEEDMLLKVVLLWLA